MVVKFIHKDKVLKGSWKDDPVLGTVPFEISLLTKLRHPNIVQVGLLGLCYRFGVVVISLIMIV